MATSMNAEWPKVKFGDVVRNVNATTKDPASMGLDRVVGLDHMDPESLPLKRWDELSDLNEGTSFTRIFRSGQVLFGKRRAYQKKVSVPDFDGICSGDILVLEPSSDLLLPDFLPYIVQSDGFFEHALGTSAGSLSPRTKWQELAKYEFVLPPVEEQLRISNLLKEMQIINGLHDLVECNIEVLSKSTFMQELGRGATLEPVELGTVCEMYQPQTISSSDLLEDGEFQVFGANGVIGKYSTFNHESAEVVVTCRGASCGNIHMTPPKSWITGNAMVVRPKNDQILKQFLFWSLKYEGNLGGVITGSAQPQITRASLQGLRITLPNIGRQQRIVRMMTALQGASRMIGFEVKTPDNVDGIVCCLITKNPH